MLIIGQFAGYVGELASEAHGDLGPDPDRLFSAMTTTTIGNLGEDRTRPSAYV